jgi:hypothetical protein
VAEDARFELARCCPQHAFQQCAPAFTHGRHIDVPLQHQGKGIGTMLVRSVEGRARAEGKEAVTPGTSRNAEGVAWKRFPGGNTSGTRSPVKRRTYGPDQSDRRCARYDCGRNSRPNEIRADERLRRQDPTAHRPDSVLSQSVVKSDTARPSLRQRIARPIGPHPSGTDSIDVASRR